MLRCDLASLALAAALGAPRRAPPRIAGAGCRSRRPPASTARPRRSRSIRARAGSPSAASAASRSGALDAPLERVLTRGPVHDLVFERDGTLLAATEVGLYPDRVGRSRRCRARRHGRSRAPVRALAVSGERSSRRPAAGVFERVAARALAVAARAGPAVRRGAARRDRRRARTASPRSGPRSTARSGPRAKSRAGGACRCRAPRRARRVRSISRRRASGELLVVLRRSLAVRSAAGEWRVEPLVLPPGALPLRIAADAGRLWLATDAGLLAAPGPAGPWQRAGAPAGERRGRRARGRARSARGGHRAGPAPTRAGVGSRSRRGELRRGRAPAAPARALRADPPITAVQRRALRYVSLDPEPHAAALGRARAAARGRPR